MKKLDLTDQRFGRLVVLEEAERYVSPSGKSKATQWLCKCDCGNQIVLPQTNIKRGNTKSCGCLDKETAHNRFLSHGMADTRQYRIWSDMKTRCDNKRRKEYEYYGQKGVTYDKNWSTFEGFWEDMKEGYDDNLTLDRIDTYGNYCKENCQWIPFEQQGRNQRKRPNNTSGVTGVRFLSDKNGNSYWMARWYSLDGDQKQKLFSVNKFGDDLAFSKACEYRKKMIEQLNEIGAGYSETHGM